MKILNSYKPKKLRRTQPQKQKVRQKLIQSACISKICIRSPMKVESHAKCVVSGQIGCTGVEDNYDKTTHVCSVTFPISCHLSLTNIQCFFLSFFSQSGNIVISEDCQVPKSKVIQIFQITEAARTSSSFNNALMFKSGLRRRSC